MLFAATAGGLARLNQLTKWGKWVARISVTTIVVASIWANNNWSQLPVKNAPKHIISQYRYFRKSGINEIFEKLAPLLPSDPDVPISVSHNLVPHLTHRNEIYMFPNPYRTYYWGISGENPPSNSQIQALFLDLSSMNQKLVTFAKHILITEGFTIDAQEGAWLVANKSTEPQNIQFVDPVDAPALDSAIRLLVYRFEQPITSLIPLWGRTPDDEFTTDVSHIPATFDSLNTVEREDLGAKDNMRIILIGQWEARGEKDIVFRIQADDGCHLYIDRDIIIDYEGVHSFSEVVESKPLRLSPGWHRIVLDYFEWGGEAGFLIEWAESSSKEFQPLRFGIHLP
jgi:hypothetical protein